MENIPLVSVIIPVYNCDRYLAEAIESVLKQTYQHIEVIVVDDGSIDKTALIAASFNDSIHYIYQPNSGPAVARNRGLRTARGNVISFLDADDLWPTNKLQLQLAYLTNNPSVEIVLGRTQFMQLTSIVDGIHKFEELSYPRLFLNLGSAIFRKTVFDQVGLLEEALFYSEDVDWFNRAREVNVSIVAHQEVVLFYRQHQYNMTSNKLVNELNVLKVLKKSLERRRIQNNGLAPSLPKLSNFYQKKLEE